MRRRPAPQNWAGWRAGSRRFIPPEIFPGGRERVYTPWVTFIAFNGQMLSRESACRQAVRRVQI